MFLGAWLESGAAFDHWNEADGGVHTSVAALEQDVRAWIKTWNDDPKPFVWTKTAEDILQSLSKYMAKISGAGH